MRNRRIRTYNRVSLNPSEEIRFMSDLLSNAPLGHEVTYPDTYDSDLLFGLSRDPNRQTLVLPDVWYGADIWNAYELSWLNSRGKPVAATGQFTFPHDSPRLIESKSLKLYLNSWNQERVPDIATLQKRIAADLSNVAGATVYVHISPLSQQTMVPCAPLTGTSIDDLDIDIRQYQPDPDLLRCATTAETVSEVLTSDLLKSNCPITGQPDWGSVQIGYTGRAIDHESLLAYIVSLRQHTEFHEHCIEKMFCDIQRACAPEALSVYARYTRRGGLDINPWRSSHPITVSNIRTIRQ